MDANLVKTSLKVVGLKQVLASIIKGTVRCVLVSNDCDSFIKDAIMQSTKNNGVEVVTSFSKRELGRLCNIDVDASVVGILK